MTEPTPSGPASLPSRIVLECDRARKSAYVRAASPRKLAAWCFEHLDRAAGFDPDKPGERAGKPHNS